MTTEFSALRGARPATLRPPVGLAAFWIVAGLAGWAVSFLLFLEYVGQLTDSEPLITCQISALVTCGPNLLSPGGNLFGFTNSIIGVTLFLGPIIAGASALAAPDGLRAWYWRVYGAFLAAAFVFVHFFAYRSIFEYGSLCPWCMIVWLATIPLFWFSLGWMLRDGVWGRPSRIGGVLLSWAPLITILDYALIAVLAQVRLDVLGSL